MAEKNLQGLRVAILVTQYFEQSELEKPKQALEAAGAEAKIISPEPGKVQGVKHTEKGDQFPVDLTLDKARPDDFDAILLPGGALNADHLRIEPKAQEFVREFDRAGKPIAVICHGPWLLISAGLVRGRTITSYHTIQDDIRNAGGKWQDSDVVHDSNWVSSRQPSDIPMFNRAMIELFTEKKAAREEKTRRVA